MDLSISTSVERNDKCHHELGPLFQVEEVYGE